MNPKINFITAAIAIALAIIVINYLMLYLVQK